MAHLRARGRDEGATVTGKFEIYKDRNGEYRFRFRAANGQIVAEGSSYPTKKAAKRAVAAVLAAAAGVNAAEPKGTDPPARDAPSL
jgi:uncharacterized protein YegP (UPF0339 family)